MTTATVNDFKPGFTPRKIVAKLRQWKNAGATVNELADKTHAPFSTTRRRVSEMLEDGTLTYGPDRKCRVTGRKVTTYRLRSRGNWLHG